MYYVYILKSLKTERFYIGYSNDIQARLVRHNAGATPSTKSGRPWRIVYYEKFSTKTDAIKREREIKKQKSREYILKLIEAFKG